MVTRDGQALVIAVLGLGQACSVIAQGMAASIVEALEAARAAGDQHWLREHIAAELAAADAATLDRIADGTRRHAVRRTAEMEAAADMLTELGVPPLMADASRAAHERLAGNEGQLRQTKASYASGASASASGPRESGFAWSGRFTMIRSAPASR
jgi:hypothetical protein